MLYRPKKIDYTSPASAQGGPGVQKQITHYFGTPYLDMTLAQWTALGSAIGASLGDTWWLGGDARANGGNAFMFVKSDHALVLGDVVTVAVPEDTTAHNPASQCTTSVCTTHFDTSTAAVNGEVNNWIWVEATGATLPQLRRIKANTAATLSAYTVAQRDYLRPNSPLDADIFDTVATDNDVVKIIRPYVVTHATATSVAVGVALGTVTANQYTIIQIAGLAAVRATNGGAALVVNVPAIMSGTDGVITGAGGTANLYNAAGSILPQFAYNAAGPGLVPCFVNFTGQ